MIILSPHGEFRSDGRRSRGPLECSKAARPARNKAIRIGLAARLQELVEEHMPEQLDFFCDWLFGELTTDQLWQRHVHATVDTTHGQKASQVQGRLRSVLLRLRKLAEDDVKSQLLLSSLEGFSRIVNNKSVDDEEIRS